MKNEQKKKAEKEGLTCTPRKDRARDLALGTPASRTLSKPADVRRTLHAPQRTPADRFVYTREDVDGINNNGEGD